jgi:hypothetical protein
MSGVDIFNTTIRVFQAVEFCISPGKPAEKVTVTFLLSSPSQNPDLSA